MPHRRIQAGYELSDRLNGYYEPVRVSFAVRSRNVADFWMVAPARHLLVWRCRCGTRISVVPAAHWRGLSIAAQVTQNGVTLPNQRNSLTIDSRGATTLACPGPLILPLEGSSRKSPKLYQSVQDFILGGSPHFSSPSLPLAGIVHSRNPLENKVYILNPGPRLTADREVPLPFVILSFIQKLATKVLSGIGLVKSGKPWASDGVRK